MNRNTMNCKRFILFIFIIISQFAYAQTAFWRVQPIYEQLEVLNENLLKVKYGEHYGIITYDGSEVTPCVYSRITPFTEGCALLLNGSRLKGIMSADGTVIQLRDEYMVDLNAPYFSEGLLAVKNTKGIWGYLDRQGEIKIAFKFIEAYPFSFGLASVAQIYKSGQKLHMHINAEGYISALSDGFNDDDLVFTGTFTNSSEGPFAIVVNTKNKIFKRALNGVKLADLGKADDFISESKVILSKQWKYCFNEDWSLKSIVGTNGKIQKSFDSDSRYDMVYTPLVPTLESEVGVNGKYDLRVLKKVVLSYQFDSVIPLTRALCAVSLSGRFGILDIYPTGNLSLNFTNASNEVSHHSPVPMDIKITNLSSLFRSYSLESAKVILPSGDEVSNIVDGDGIHFEYLPSLNGDFSETFSISYQISGLTYPEQQINADFSYHPAFRVTWPAENVSLDSRHTAVFDIIVENRSSSASDQCEILVDGKSYGKIVFKPNQKRTMQITKLVDIQDEDSISKQVNVVIREEGCPDYKIQHTLVFNRYFIN